MILCLVYKGGGIQNRTSQVNAVQGRWDLGLNMLLHYIISDYISLFFCVHVQNIDIGKIPVGYRIPKMGGGILLLLWPRARNPVPGSSEYFLPVFQSSHLLCMLAIFSTLSIIHMFWNPPMGISFCQWIFFVTR